MADLDEILREGLRSDGERYRSRPIEAEIAFTQKLRRRRLRNGIGVTVMILALGTGAGLAARALTRATSFIEPAPSVVPWVDATPTPEVDQTPPPQAAASVPACEARDLGARFLTGGAATGHDFTVIEFTNFGTSECAVQGVPSITLLKSRGDPLAATQSTGSFFPDNGDERVALRPEGFGGPIPPDQPLIGRGLLIFEWTDCTDDTVSSVDVTLPNDGGTVRLSTDTGDGPSLIRSNQPACDGGLTTQTKIDVNHFQSVPIPARALVDYSHLSVTIEAPPSVVAGARLRYTVTITNDGADPFLFHPCPAYSQNLYKSGGLYLLNCANAASIRPGDGETFEMILNVFDFTPPGHYPLSWRFGTGSDLPVVQPVTVEVLAP